MTSSFGGVFAVSAGLGGSVVSVVEGSVAVNQPGRDVLLSPGEQAASNPALASDDETAVREAIRDFYAAYSSFDQARYRATTTDDYLLLEQGELFDREGDVDEPVLPHLVQDRGLLAPRGVRRSCLSSRRDDGWRTVDPTVFCQTAALDGAVLANLIQIARKLVNALRHLAAVGFKL